MIPFPRFRSGGRSHPAPRMTVEELEEQIRHHLYGRRSGVERVRARPTQSPEHLDRPAETAAREQPVGQPS
jgi:hypothetical protein